MESRAKSEFIAAEIHASLATGEVLCMLREDDAEAILLGRARFAKFAEECEQELEIPVLAGVVCAVKMAEGIVEFGKSTSKAKTYRPPETKSFTGIFERFGSRHRELQRSAG